MRSAIKALLAGVATILAASLASANHQAGHTERSALGSAQVKVVRHSFPASIFPDAQWETTSTACMSGTPLVVRSYHLTAERFRI